MKPVPPSHDDAFDELITAALHGDLTPAERTVFDARLSNDSAARAAYQEAQAMHDLLEKNAKTAQPDPAFEQRMVSAVRRKLRTEKHTETPWESAAFFYRWIKQRLAAKWTAWEYGVIGGFALIVIGCSFVFYHDLRLARSMAGGWASPTPPPTEADFYLPPKFYADVFKRRNVGQRFALDVNGKDLQQVVDQQGITYVESAQKGITLGGYVDSSYTQQFSGRGVDFNNGASSTKVGSGQLTLTGGNTYTGGTVVNSGGVVTVSGSMTIPGNADGSGNLSAINSSGGTGGKIAVATSSPPLAPINNAWSEPNVQTMPQGGTIRGSGFAPSGAGSLTREGQGDTPSAPVTSPAKILADADSMIANFKAKDSAKQSQQEQRPTGNLNINGTQQLGTATPAQVDNRKLIRNATLDLEVKSYQGAVDTISALTRDADGYVDTSHSQRGGNGKLQGTIVVKVLPQNLDAFLLKLREMGNVTNQSVSTDDVTKAYFDMQARLENSRRMETQLQDLLKRENGKVSDLLQVERELGRVRGEIEQMQGQLKLYDFQVQYATVTMNLREKDLNQAAAYLLKEQDDFSLFATDVESTFQQARHAADDFKAQVLQANLNHNSGADVSAELVVMVAPDQIEPFLGQVRGLGRVANFTRQTQRVAKDGGDSDQPADQTLTEKDKVQVHLAIRSDDETRKQVALTLVAKAVDEAFDQAKAAALAQAGVQILSSSLNKTPQGQSAAQLSLRVPGKDYAALMIAFKALGRTASLSIQRNDNSGPGANGDDAPVIVTIALTDNDTPLQQTQLAVLAADVDARAQQIKKDAVTAGAEVKASSFQRQPDGTELAQITFRLPMGRYAAFLESVKTLGKVESLTVRRDDRPDQTVTDDTAPVDIELQLHNQRDIVAPNDGLFATLRQTFGEGAGALFGSVRVIGVLIAFALPWVVALVIAAWIGRRIYVWRKK